MMICLLKDKKTNITLFQKLLGETHGLAAYMQGCDSDSETHYVML